MIERYKKFGIGKKMGSDLYIHQSYLNQIPLSERILEARETLNLRIGNYKFDIIRINLKSLDVSFIQCPEFNQNYHPRITSSVKIHSNNSAGKIRHYKSNPPIYHHRWTFVKNDYERFDVDKDKKWSSIWTKTPDLNPLKYGREDHWTSITLPKIFNHYNARSDITSFFSF